MVEAEPSSEGETMDADGPDAQRIKLDANFTRTRAHGHGWVQIPFGAAFVAVAAGIVYGVLSGNMKPSQGIKPELIAVLVGGAFGIPGLFVMGQGIASYWAYLAAQRRRQQHTREPWLADHVWDPTGIRDDGWRRLSGLFVGVGIFAAVLGPMQLVFFTLMGNKGPACFFWAFFALFDLIFIAMLWHLLYKITQRLKYGGSRVQFDRFPYYLGETLDVTFINRGGIGNFNRITFTLRCVEEVEEIHYRRSKGGRRRETRIVPYQVYKDVFVVEVPGRLDAASVGVPVSFLLPETGLATRLSDYPATYWELDIYADTPGVDFHAVFLVPVYQAA